MILLGPPVVRSEQVDEQLDLQDTTGRHLRPLLWVI